MKFFVKVFVPSCTQVPKTLTGVGLTAGTKVVPELYPVQNVPGHCTILTGVL